MPMQIWGLVKRMSNNLEQTIERICHNYNNDRTLMMNVVSDVQAELKGLSSEALDLIARHLNTHRVEVESLVSFYAFYSQESTGKVVIRLVMTLLTVSGCRAYCGCLRGSAWYKNGRNNSGRSNHPGMDALHRHVRPGSRCLDK